MSEDQPADKPAAPLFSVVSGNPTDEDLAVLVTVFAAASGGPADTGPQVRNYWGLPADRLTAGWGMPTSFTNVHFG